MLTYVNNIDIVASKWLDANPNLHGYVKTMQN